MTHEEPPPPLLRRIANLLTALAHQARWSWRFGDFGFRSRLVNPDLLTRPGSIHIGRRVLIGKRARLEVVEPDGSGHRPRIEIGDLTSIQRDFHCGAARSVRIGREVLIAGRVHITDHDHRIDDPTRSPRRSRELVARPVAIGDGVWLGEGCVVLKGVTIGNRAVVGANAVVTRDVPPRAVVAGVPAKVIRMLPP
jgi:acetyltransferase-like isoleucine patch superfamily enzyme